MRACNHTLNHVYSCPLILLILSSLSICSPLSSYLSYLLPYSNVCDPSTNYKFSFNQDLFAQLGYWWLVGNYLLLSSTISYISWFIPMQPGHGLVQWSLHSSLTGTDYRRDYLSASLEVFWQMVIDRRPTAQLSLGHLGNYSANSQWQLAWLSHGQI